MSKIKMAAIIAASTIGLTILIVGGIFIAPKLSIFENLKQDPYAATAREVTIGFEILGRDYAASGMTFGGMIAQTETSKRNFDSLLIKLQAPTSDKEKANEKLVKDYILSASNVAYSLRKYLNAHMQVDIAQKSISAASDTSVCGSNYSLSAHTCLLGVGFKQQAAIEKAESTKRQKATAESDKSLALSKYQNARQNLIKAGYNIDDQNSSAINLLSKNI